MDAGRHGLALPSFRDTSEAALWPAQPVQLARGRQPRDALAKLVTYNVSSLHDFEASLREYLSSPPEQPEHTEAQFSFFVGTVFLVPDPDAPKASASSSKTRARQQPAALAALAAPPAPQHLLPLPHHQPANPRNGLPPLFGRPPLAYPAAAAADPLPAFVQPAHGAQGPDAARKHEHRVSLTIPEALAATPDPKSKMRKQRAIAKSCVDAIQRVDGYRYSFHNCWNSREDDSFRFSYYCNDSLLNKDRAANGKGAKLGKRATKPVYDCKGVLSIKFSATKKGLDVFYKHVPIHGTYEERAPPPRKDSKRRKFLELHDPEALERIISRPKGIRLDDTVTILPKRRRMTKAEAQSLSNTSIESDLRTQSLHSLLELICVDPVTPEETGPSRATPPPPPIPPPPPHYPVLPEPPVLHMQSQSIHQRKRPRYSCEACKLKKTKCDGMKPVCSTCIERRRPCYYADLGNGDDRDSPSESTEMRQEGRSELSELEKMRRELEDAKARIQELESEKRAAPPPAQTPQGRSLPPSQPQTQPYQRSQNSHSQGQPHAPPQRQPPPSTHRQQLHQKRALSSPQQLTYKLDNQPLQQQIQAAAQNYFSTHASPSPYSTLTRSVPPNPHLPQPTPSAQTQPPPPPPPPSSSHIHGNDSSGLPTLPSPVDTNHPYNRSDYTWPPQPHSTPSYYSYSSAASHASQAQQQGGQQQGGPALTPSQLLPPQPLQPPTQQHDQWVAARGASLFR